MREESSFGRYHPAVLFSYYICVILFAMFTTHPAVLVAVMIGAICFFALLYPLRVLARNLAFYLGAFLLIALCNPLLVHSGETVLFFMKGKPITLEATCYGAAVSAVIVGVMLWCKSYASILTTDKFLYLFGRKLPKLSLVLSMAIRFLPLFKQQAKRIGNARKAMGLNAEKSRIDRLLGGVKTFDGLLSWSLENSIDTADAMRARGYGLSGRTSFSLFQFRKHDVILLGVMFLLAAIIGVSYLQGSFSFLYYPVVGSVSRTTTDILRYGTVLLFMLLPSIIEAKEKILWNYLKSKI